ncbi:MAG: DUF2813 domain-containing protein [Magnetococcales bacterium]|nr:DUF2813 domain-containing protein [Magnetococcales bacterium]
MTLGAAGPPDRDLYLALGMDYSYLYSNIFIYKGTMMKLRRLQIENFRGIASLDLELDDTTVLIGENNTGKTAVLEALRFALREVRSRRGCAFDVYDFHLPEARSEPSAAPAISIRLTFREDESGEGDNERKNKQKEERRRILNRAGILQVDSDGHGCIILQVGAKFHGETQEFIHDWEFQNLDGVPLKTYSDAALSIFQKEVSYYYLSALRDSARHFDAKGTFWRPFLKESQLTREKHEEIELKLAEVNDLIVSSHTSFSKVVGRLNEINEVVSMAGDGNLVSVDAVPGRLFDILAKAQVNLNAETGAKIPVGRHGEGTQSLAVLALFNAFLQTWNQGAAIIAMEEPEAHLHPSAVRALWKLIERIPGQKIISTHSGDLLSEVPPNSIVRLDRQQDKTIPRYVRNIKFEEKKKKQFNDHIRYSRGELLFEKCWILVEGETEIILLPELARIIGRNLERSGVRCVYHRHASIEMFINVAKELGIHWISIHDTDTQGNNDLNHGQKNLESRPEDKVLFKIKGNVEQYLCTNGFHKIYEHLLTKQSQKKITVEPGHDDYFEQLTMAVKEHKIAAVYQVLDEIREKIKQAPDGEKAKLVPELLVNIIDTAIEWAESR